MPESPRAFSRYDMTRFDPKPVLLEGPRIRLEPFEAEHREPLAAAARDLRIWSSMTIDLTEARAFDSWWHDSLERLEAAIPFAIRVAKDRRVIGAVRYMNIARRHRRLEIGQIWFPPAFWGQAVNLELNALLLEHAFEALDAVRVEYRCDAENARSHAAILKLGAVEEGRLRRHMIVLKGRVRDSLQFSIVDSEWLVVKARLTARLVEALSPLDGERRKPA